MRVIKVCLFLLGLGFVSSSWSVVSPEFNTCLKNQKNSSELKATENLLIGLVKETVPPSRDRGLLIRNIKSVVQAYPVLLCIGEYYDEITPKECSTIVKNKIKKPIFKKTFSYLCVTEGTEFFVELGDQLLEDISN